MGRSGEQELQSLRLVGERIILTGVQPERAEQALSLVQNTEEILRWLHWDGPEDLADMQERFAHWILPPKPEESSNPLSGVEYVLAIIDRSSDALVGVLRLNFSGHPGTGDLSYWVGLPFQRQGYASEAIRLAAHLAFEELGAVGLCAWVMEGNRPSRRLLEKLGFSWVRRIAVGPSRARQGGHEDYLALLSSDWRGLRGDWTPGLVEVIPADRGSTG